MRTDMRAQIAAILDEHRARRSHIERLQAAARPMTVVVRSPDRSVTVTVDAQGELCDIRIDPAAAAQLDWTSLSARILGASRLASAQAREQMRVTMRDALPARLRDLVATDGSVDLGAMLLSEVEGLSRVWTARR